MQEISRHENKEVRDFTRRFSTRDNYKFIGELNLPRNTKYKCDEKRKQEIINDIVDSQKTSFKPAIFTAKDLHVAVNNITYVPQDQYENIRVWDDQGNVKSINKFNYLGRPEYPYELSLRFYIKDKSKLKNASEACHKYVSTQGKQFQDVDLKGDNNLKMSQSGGGEFSL